MLADRILYHLGKISRQALNPCNITMHSDPCSGITRLHITLSASSIIVSSPSFISVSYGILVRQAGHCRFVPYFRSSSACKVPYVLFCKSRLHKRTSYTKLFECFHPRSEITCIICICTINTYLIPFISCIFHDISKQGLFAEIAPVDWDYI